MNRRLVAVLMASALLVAACDEDMALAQDFIKQWALDHAVEIGKAGLGIPSGDAYVDAAVEAGKPVLALQEGDELMAKGRKDQDAKAMDEAIKKRPDDWTYQLSRANLALQQGDMGKYNKTWDDANRDFHPPKKPDQPLQVYNQPYFQQEYFELNDVHKRLSRGEGSVTGYKSFDQCQRLYSRLIAIAANPDSGLAIWGGYLEACDSINH